MKNMMFCLLFALPMALPSKNLEGQNPGLDAIKTALAAGDAEGLSRFFGESVEVSILENEQVLDRAGAAQAVRNFFAQSKPKGFTQMHSGASKGSDDQYCIGNLTTGGTTYRVYLYLKMSGGQPTIQEVRFDKA